MKTEKFPQKIRVVEHQSAKYNGDADGIGYYTLRINYFDFGKIEMIQKILDKKGKEFIALNKYNVKFSGFNNSGVNYVEWYFEVKYIDIF